MTLGGRERERETERDRDRDRDRETETDRQTDRQSKMQSTHVYVIYIFDLYLCETETGCLVTYSILSPHSPALFMTSQFMQTAWQNKYINKNGSLTCFHYCDFQTLVFVINRVRNLPKPKQTNKTKTKTKTKTHTQKTTTAACISLTPFLSIRPREVSSLRFICQSVCV